MGRRERGGGWGGGGRCEVAEGLVLSKQGFLPFDWGAEEETFTWLRKAMKEFVVPIGFRFF
jgi:hypothetical protein